MVTKLDQSCPHALDKKPEKDEIEINIDSIDPRTFHTGQLAITRESLERHHSLITHCSSACHYSSLNVPRYAPSPDHSSPITYLSPHNTKHHHHPAALSPPPLSRTVVDRMVKEYLPEALKKSKKKKSTGGEAAPAAKKAKA